MGNINLLMVKHSQMESERILLRPVLLDDAEDMYEYTSDEETTRFIYDQHTDIILELAFNTLALERVFAEHDIRNSASGKVLSRLGMTYEGTRRRNHIVKGVLTDSAHYSILKEEYAK